MNVDDDPSHGIVREYNPSLARAPRMTEPTHKGERLAWDEDELFPTGRATPEQVAAGLKLARDDNKAAEARRASGL